MKAAAASDPLPAQVPTEPVNTDSTTTLQSLADLRRALSHAKGAGFSLFIAVCNQPSQREAAMQALKKSLPGWHWAQATLNSDTTSVLAAAKAALRPGGGKNPVSPDALMLDGLEQVVRQRTDQSGPDQSQPILQGLNLGREAWPQEAPVPVILWTSDFLLPLLAQYAPDFLDWRSGTALFPAEASTDIEAALDRKDFGDHHATALTPEMRQARLKELEDRIAVIDTGDAHLGEIHTEWLVEAAGHAARLGMPARAEQLMEQAIKVCRLAGDSQGEFWALTTQGHAWLAAGDLSRSMASFRNGLEISERMVWDDPRNAEWQRELSVSHSRLGDVQRSQGDLAGALASFRKAMEISERLARQDPSNDEWQRDLNVNHGKLGNVQLTQGDWAGALASFRKAMEISERLARQDPINAQWQRDLSLSHGKLGNVQLAQGDLTGALASFRKAVEICERLAQHDPYNAHWQGDLLVNHSKLGDAQLAQGDLAGALAVYHRVLEVCKRLAGQDPSNAQWQRDLWVSYWKMASVLEAAGDGSSGQWLRKAYTQLSVMKERGLFVSLADERLLEQLQQKVQGPVAAPEIRPAEHAE
jgi:tetratricopeptide (TPR) repeat protein